MPKRRYIPPRSEWTRLNTPEDLLQYLKAHKLAPEKATEPKTLYYEDPFSHDVTPCTVCGYVDPWTTVIDIEGQLHCIHPDYLVEMQSKKRYFVFDVETPNHNNDRISSIGIVMMHGSTILNTYHYLINPEVPFDDFNVRLTGISSDTVKDSPAFPEVWGQIRSLFRGSVAVAHNAPFDLSVLQKTLAAYHIEESNIDYLCTLSLSRKALPQLASHKLNAICQYYHIPLDHHQADSDSRACAEILKQLMDSGVQVNRSIKTYQFQSINQPQNRNQFKPCYSEETLAMQELLKLFSQVTEDNILTEEEASAVNAWIESHPELEGNYPFDRAFAALRTALEDHVFQPDELKELCTLFRQLSDPVAQTSGADTPIELEGKLVCLTGDFEYGPRTDVENLLAQKGAIVKKSVIKKLNYLIVGECGSTAWTTGNYGNKIKKAMELQEKGCPVLVMKERDFFAALHLTESGSKTDES